MAVLIVGAFALLMDAALRRSLEAEDTLVLEGQAASLARLAAEGRLAATDPLPRPEKAEWRLIRADGTRRESPGFAALLPFDAAAVPADGRVHDADAQGGRTLDLLRLRLPDGELLLALDRSHEATWLRGFREVLLLGALLSALAAALMGRTVARRSLRALERLAEETAAVRPGGPFHALDPGPFPSELAPVVDTLNGALARLQGAIQRLEHMGSELAHELRTPLQHLRSPLEDLALGRRPLDPPALREDLGRALEACDRLESLIEDILLLAHSEDPTATLRWQTLSATDLLEEARAFFEAVAEEAGLSLEVAAPPDLSFAADPVLLMRALHNLLGNALKATPPGGRVRLEAGRLDGAPFLAVRDTGPGLPSELKARLGEWWLRGQGGSGHGLGLAIAQGILKLHGGRLDMRENEGGGTWALLRLPPSAPGAA